MGNPHWLGQMGRSIAKALGLDGGREQRRAPAAGPNVKPVDPWPQMTKEEQYDAVGKMQDYLRKADPDGMASLPDEITRKMKGDIDEDGGFIVPKELHTEMYKLLHEGDVDYIKELTEKVERLTGQFAEARAAFDQILTITGQTQQRPYTALSEIAQLARKGLMSCG